MSLWNDSFFQNTKEIISGFLPWNFLYLPGGFLEAFWACWGLSRWYHKYESLQEGYYKINWPLDKILSNSLSITFILIYREISLTKRFNTFWIHLLDTYFIKFINLEFHFLRVSFHVKFIPFAYKLVVILR